MEAGLSLRYHTLAKRLCGWGAIVCAEPSTMAGNGEDMRGLPDAPGGEALSI